MTTAPLDLEVFQRDEDRFGEVRGRRVLIYWPHGFGDFVFLLPLLEPSNRYYVTRWGDANTALFDGCAGATPMYLGMNSTHCGDGVDFGNAQFGLRDAARRAADGRTMPLALHAACVRERIDAVVDPPFFETYGRSEFPLHSKARHMLRHLVSAERIAGLALDQPLRSGLHFAAPASVRTRMEARLRSAVGWRGRELHEQRQHQHRDWHRLGHLARRSGEGWIHRPALRRDGPATEQRLTHQHRERRRGAPTRWRGASFFISQPQRRQRVMDGGQGALQRQRGAQFLERQVWLPLQERTHLAMMTREDLRLAPGAIVARPDLSGVAALLQELFDHAQRHLETLRDLFTRAFLPIVASQDPFAQVQGERSHGRSLPLR